MVKAGPERERPDLGQHAARCHKAQQLRSHWALTILKSIGHDYNYGNYLAQLFRDRALADSQTADAIGLHAAHLRVPELLAALSLQQCCSLWMQHMYF